MFKPETVMAVFTGVEKYAIRVPDTSANAGETVTIPIRIDTRGVNINSAQFVLDYNSSVLAYQSASIGSGASGFSLTTITNLPYQPSTTGTDKNVLIQINGWGMNFINGSDREVALLAFTVAGSYGDTSLVALDNDQNRTYLETESHQTIRGDDISFDDGLFRVGGVCPFTYRNTGKDPYAITINHATIYGVPVQNGDCIGVFDGVTCVSAYTYDGSAISFSAWAADPGNSLPGYTTGNTMIFRPLCHR